MAKSTTTPGSGLPRYEGHDVTRSTIQITNAGDGLSDALDIDPVAYGHGQEVYVVLRARCVDVQHPPADPKDESVSVLVRKHKLKTISAAVVDEAVVKPILDEHTADVARRKAERDGQYQLGEDVPDDGIEGGSVTPISGR